MLGFLVMVALKCADALGYENGSKTSFTLGRVVNYTGAAQFGGSFYLNYDGHPGYDYAAGNGTPVFAAVTGKIPWNAVGMTTRNYDAYCWRYIRIITQIILSTTYIFSRIRIMTYSAS